MSDVYLRRLARVQTELDVARDVTSYVRANWHRQSVFDAMNAREDRQQHDIERLADNLEAIFLIQMFATFEGVLKQHMTEHHATEYQRQDPKRINRYWLIDAVVTGSLTPLRVCTGRKSTPTF